ncbi:hypothetical protein C8P63_1455 [Melghirimyces profundicolus]|uniref:Uncharacterized protein n=1 Tax=Melghirimyces profundicolus TaxID=1242148 RepID=A0A2T6AXF7_9BACL|nr:hypothetical protein [Melghirimyces profundicolus]PTX48490.1 hypothetical protein C8P63_1455 [Melghirimyces profundicolus]
MRRSQTERILVIQTVLHGSADLRDNLDPIGEEEGTVGRPERTGTGRPEFPSLIDFHPGVG